MDIKAFDTMMYCFMVRGKNLFSIDERILSTCVVLSEWRLSTVLLKNEASFPWLILIPRRADIQEVHQLGREDRIQLMDEMQRTSLLLSDFFKPDKLNIGALGNIVSQLHIHVVGRRKQDPLWPHGIWQSSLIPTPYEPDELANLVTMLQALLKNDSMC